MLSLRAFMFERVYLGPETRAEHERARATVQPRSSTRSPTAATPPDEITEFIAGMTDRFALEYAARLARWPRIKDTTVEAVRQGADFVAVVEERTPLRKAGARLVGRCPFHEERTPSFSVNPVDKLYYCFGCGKGGDMITFVRETQGLDFVGAIEWLAERFRIPLEYEEASPGDDARAPPARAALRAARRRRPRFYERVPLGLAGRLARARLPRGPRPRRGDLPRVPARARARRQRRSTRKALEKGFTLDELRAAGLTRQRGGDYFQRRLVFPLADARGRVLGFQARRLHEDDPLQAKYVNTPESELFHKGVGRLRPRPGARRDRARGPRVRRRGQHRRDRAPPGRASSRSSRAWARRSPSSSSASSAG